MFSIFGNAALDKAKESGVPISKKDYRELFRNTITSMRSNLRTQYVNGLRGKKDPTKAETDEVARALKSYYPTLPDIVSSFYRS